MKYQQETRITRTLYTTSGKVSKKSVDMHILEASNSTPHMCVLKRIYKCAPESTYKNVCRCTVCGNKNTEPTQMSNRKMDK